MKATAFASVAAISLVACLSSGCSSVPKDRHDPEHVGYREVDKHTQIWMAHDFQLAPDAQILVSRVRHTVVAPESDAWLEERAGMLQVNFVQALNARLVHPSAIAEFEEVSHRRVRYRLDMTIVDASEGNRPLATFVTGTFGLGHPWVVVRGTLVELPSGKPIFRFLAKRGFDGHDAVDSWYGTEDPMAGHLRNLALEMADIIERARDGRPLTGKETAAR